MKQIYLLLLVIFVSRCQTMPIQISTPPRPSPSIIQKQTSSIFENELVSRELLCGIVYQNGYKFGLTHLDEMERWLKHEDEDYVVMPSAKNPKVDYIKITSPITSTTLMFYDDVLFGTEIRALPQGAYSFGQIVSALGVPEYFDAGLAYGATPVGACEKECYYYVEMLYPSKGVDVNTIAGTGEKTITINENMKIKYITCYEPGKREQYQRFLYGRVWPLSQGKKWSGFGIEVQLRK